MGVVGVVADLGWVSPGAGPGVGGRLGEREGGGRVEGRGATYSLAKLVFYPAILLDPCEVRLTLLFRPNLRRPRDAVLEALR